MVKISRYILVLIGIMVSAIAIPDLFWTVFREGTSTPIVSYSHVLDDFIIIKSSDQGVVRMDTKGNTYGSSSEIEELLPMMFYRQLSSEGKMPATIKGVEMDHAIISTHRASYRFMARNINTPSFVLLPMLESQSGRVNLSLPKDFFRLKKSMEFIVAETNQVDKEKSKLFNDALIANDFAFPARLIAGLPTTLKSRDEGYFIKDDRGDLFHVKMVKGQPFIGRVDIPDHINIIHIECVDLRTEEFYAYLYSENKEVYVLMNEVYYLQKLPIDDFDYTKDQVRITTDVFGKTISVMGDDFVKVTRVDDLYDVVDTYQDTWEPSSERTDHKLFARLFPFQLRMQHPDSRYISFFVNYAHGMAWLLLNLLLVILTVWLLRRKDQDVKKHGIDLVIILFAGIFGFIATRVFPNKFYE